MHNKKHNSNKTQNFIQGLRPFASSIPHGLKKILKKGGYNFSNIVNNWTKMVGKEISGSCYPSTIKNSRDVNNAILVLNVIHGKELAIEYGKKEIIDKINSFFGYHFIGQIKLKVVQEERVEKKINKLESKSKKLDQKINNIEDANLKNSLGRLIKAFNEKND
jgi:hypothetical protein